MNPRVALHVGLIALIPALVIALALIRSGNPPPKPQKHAVVSRPAEAPAKAPEVPEIAKAEVNPEKLPVVLGDATLKGLIQNAKVAQLRGDAKTRDAMVRGLKKQPERSRDLIQQEISSSRDHNTSVALQKLMEALQ